MRQLVEAIRKVRYHKIETGLRKVRRAQSFSDRRSRADTGILDRNTAWTDMLHVATGEIACCTRGVLWRNIPDFSALAG